MGKGFFVLATASLLAAIAWPQGSAGQYGQKGGGGFGGGGFGGGMGGGGIAGGDAHPVRENKADADEDLREWTTKTAVLTPGDRVEYKFALKANEAVFASAVSESFDPALAFCDSKGAELVRNDDRQEGNQSPFLIFRAPKEGEYLLKVISYRSASGGKFIVRFRRFPVQVVGLGTQKHGFAPVFPLSGKSSPLGLMLVLSLKSQQVIDLRDTFRGAFARIVGPSGVPEKDFDQMPSLDQPVFRALKDGDFYLEYEVQTPGELETDFREVEVVKFDANASTSIKLEAQEVKLVEFPFTNESLVRTTLTGRVLQYFDIARSDDQEPSPTFFPYSAQAWSDRDTLRLFTGNGMARLIIRNPDVQAVTVALANTTKLDDWRDGVSIKEDLALGETRFWMLQSKKSDLIRVAAVAKAFRLQFAIVRMNGERANTLVSSMGNPIRDDLYFPDEGRFLILLSCIGDGGSGPFELSRRVLEPKPIQFGSAQTINLDGGNFGLYSLELHKDRRYEVILSKASRVDFLDEGGEFLISQRIDLGSVTIYYFVPERTGRHRLWLRGDAGERKFRVQETVPPKLDG